MSIRRRLERVEHRFTPDPAPPHSYLATEVREIDRNIARLKAEIAEFEAGMTPEEVARERAEFEEFRTSLHGLTLDEQIDLLKAEIAKEEAEGGGGIAIG